jgi:hypothetical protein
VAKSRKPNILSSLPPSRGGASPSTTSFGQAKGRLTKTRYKNATIFVDHFSRLQYIHLMTTNSTLSETLEAKHAFERFAAKHGVKIAHYHCNNGRFEDTAFIRSFEESRQKITFCRVNAHF